MNKTQVIFYYKTLNRKGKSKKKMLFKHMLELKDNFKKCKYNSNKLFNKINLQKRV